jgi:DNA-binding MarR family transcriptional regulator
MPPSPELDDDFVGCLAGNLRAATRVVTRAYDATLRDTGLRITQIALLAEIGRRQPLSVTDLAAGVAGERSAVARDLALLGDAGLVTVDVNAADRRARDVALTAEGARRLRAAAPAWRSAQQAMREALGRGRVDELVSLTRALVGVLDRPEAGA